ncbi:hypothetical protein GCM10008986_17910 [Salinibacillus aidingensis]|uniref:DUF2249 domain-containing protein n=1 Tax=Salinibacillus aidingensis TaxID=237684 RepID=A0ABN1B7U4_9BACI
MQSFVEVDVREDIRLNKEPFHKIMNAIKNLEEGQGLILHAPFKPIPLFKVLDRKGFDHEEEKLEKKHWKVTFRKREGEKNDHIR